MNTFDRYILRSFLKNYVLSFCILVGLYVVLDMVLNIDNFSRSAATAAGQQVAREAQGALTSLFRVVYNIGDYYFFQTFQIYAMLSGIIPVAAAAFTFYRMTRSNELTAMLAAGVPLLRLAAPIIVAGLLLNGLLVVDQELVIPNISDKLMRDREQAGQDRAETFSIKAMEDKNASLLLASKYFPPGKDSAGNALPATMREIDIIERDAAYQPVAHIRAVKATYAGDGVWQLEGGSRFTGIRPGQPSTRAAVATWRTNISPVEIALYKSSNVLELLSTQEISELLQHPRSYGTAHLLRVKHWRMAQPVGNILLLMLAIPCVLTRDPSSLKWSTTRTVLLTGLCFACMFIAHQLAAHPQDWARPMLWPALVCWMPVFIFGPVAVILMDRVRS